MITRRDLQHSKSITLKADLQDNICFCEFVAGTCRFDFSRTLLLLLAGLATSITSVQAGDASGHINYIQLTNNSNAVLFSLNRNIEKTPNCNARKLFAIDLLQTGGNAMYQLLLEARRYGYLLNVSGLNTCAVHFEAEGVKSIEAIQ
jgi:hypothetical protein